MKKIDCTKITTIEEIRLILETLIVHISVDAPHYDKLKHLVAEDENSNG